MRRYLSVDDLIQIHEYLIGEFGGIHGIRDIKALESAVMCPQSGYYPGLFEEAAALMESFAVNHPFLDGNKRIAFFATDIFLRLNDCFIECEDEKAYHYLLELFDRKEFNFKNLLVWIKKNNKKIK